VLKTLRHVLAHALLLLASIYLYRVAAAITSNAGPGRIGPEFWPKAILVAMGLLCAWEIVKRLVLRSRSEARGLVGALDRPQGAEGAAGAETPFRPGMLAAGIALVFGYVLAVPWLGFFVATAVFLAAFPWCGGLRRPALTATLGVAGSLVLVVMFMRVAYISLPLGEGPFRALSLALLAAIGVS